MPTPAVLAGLAGYSDLTYRLICRGLSAGYCTTEVALDTSINLSAKLRRKLIQTDPRDHPLAGQIMGAGAETMVTATRHLTAMGCDVVDLNFACPVRKALRRGRGGHMMRDPHLAIAVLRAVAAAVDVPLTLKLRRSFIHTDTACDAFWRIAEAAFDAGAVAICVHSRSVEERYCGQADWGFLSEVKRHFADNTIIGSGDLLTAEAGVQMLRQTGVDGVCFARGALGNPWIFGQFAQLLAGEIATGPTLAQQRAILEEHRQLCIELFGEICGVKKMYRFGIRYSKCHPSPKLVRQAFINAKCDETSHFDEIIATYYK
ncbi:MAG: tRNA-dihydrouridine synthase [Planctomycetes bacterium]|nr:tRNA-dihydrouridine synthase [Planctomycetota bacterium]